MDAGAIVAQRSTRVLPGDTEDSLAERVKSECEHVIFPRSMELVARRLVTLRVQSDGSTALHWATTARDATSKQDRRLLDELFGTHPALV